MVKVKNNTGQIIHLPYGGMLGTGITELEEGQWKQNARHRIIKRRLQQGKLEVIDSEAAQQPEEPEEQAAEQEEPAQDEYPIEMGGGGWYELSDGSKVQGRERAIKRQRQLNQEGE